MSDKLAKAREAKKKKAKAAKQTLAEEEKKRAEEAIKTANEKQSVEDSGTESAESKDEVDVAEYLNTLVRKQLRVAYEDIIKPKLKKQVKIPKPSTPLVQSVEHHSTPIPILTPTLPLKSLFN